MKPLFYDTVERHGPDVVAALRRSEAMWKSAASLVPLDPPPFTHQTRNGAVMRSIARGDAADRLENLLQQGSQVLAIAEYQQAAMDLVSDARSHADFVRKHCPAPSLEPADNDSEPFRALKALLVHEDVLLAHSPEARDAAAAARKALIDAQVPVIDLYHVAMEQMHEAARESNWIPPEYMANDWQADVCKFLREGPAAFMPDVASPELEHEGMKP